MVFNSLPFLVFLPLFLIAYFATRGTVRLWICLIGSYLFYGWWDWRFLGLIGLSTLIDYFIGLRLGGETDEGKRRTLLILSLVANLGMLGLFKYFHFFADSLVAAAASLGVELSPTTINIILPVGISFFTFQTMSYSIDVYRRRCEVEPSLLRFATFVAFFPQLVAGPIVRASTMLPQLRTDQRFCWERVLDGAILVAWGFVLKSVFADSLALTVDSRFANPLLNNGLSNLIGIVFYAFQIYCDFNGYSMIAIGIGKILGFDFGMNFRRPYFANSFSEFWQRWHISLSSWLRDYLYIPLGGNRRGSTRTLINLLITMLLGGLWHGAAWRFVVWGGLHGLYLVGQRLISARMARTPGLQSFASSLMFRLVSIATVFLLTCIAWVFFRAESFGDAITMLRSVANLSDYDAGAVGQKFHILKGAMMIAILIAVEFTAEVWSTERLLKGNRVLYCVAMALMIWSLALFGTYSSQSFIYFQF